MFTGIIETIALVADAVPEGSNIHFTMQSELACDLKVDQSVAHNGVCLTVTEIMPGGYKVTAVAETLAKTTLDTWRKGDKINTERSLRVGDRLDGHFVQGHVDAVATCIEKQTLQGSWLYRFRFPKEFAVLVIEKGSVCVDGVSLTAFNVGRDEFTVTIIPYTYDNTNFSSIVAGSSVNIEFDVLGKYFLRNGEINVKMQNVKM